MYAHHTECLSLLLQAQAIDTVHVEGCYALLCRLMEQECGLCGHVQGMPLPPTAFEGLVDSIRSTQKNSEVMNGWCCRNGVLVVVLHGEKGTRM